MYLNEIRSAKENRRSTKSNTAVKFGGLDWNRTSDTRIFKARGAQKLNVYGRYSVIACHVLQTVLLPKYRNLLHVFNLSQIIFFASFKELAASIFVTLLL